MSESNAFDAIRWARGLGGLVDAKGRHDTTLHLLAYTLASRANGRTGRDLWPSISLLMADTGLPKTTIRDALARGEKLGLWVSEGINAEGNECWRLCLDVDLSDLDTAQKRAEENRARSRERSRQYREREKKKRDAFNRMMESRDTAESVTSHGELRDAPVEQGISPSSRTQPYDSPPESSYGERRDVTDSAVSRHTVNGVTSHGTPRRVTHSAAGTNPVPTQDDQPRLISPGQTPSAVQPTSAPESVAEDDAPPPPLAQEDLLNFGPSFTPLSAEEIDEQPTPKKSRKTPQARPTDDPEFDAFVAAYPPGRRTVGKKPAQQAWKTAMKKASAEEVIAGAKRYSALCERERREDRHVKHMASWLNAEAWADEIPIESKRWRTYIDQGSPERHAEIQASLANASDEKKRFNGIQMDTSSVESGVSQLDDLAQAMLGGMRDGNNT